MLIEINIIKPENIRLFIKKKKAYINTYNINIPIFIKR